MGDKFITIRIKPMEFLLIKESAHRNGFTGMSTFLLWLFRKYGSKK